MFLGEFEHTIDEKGRIAIPARFREEISMGLVITRGFDHCLQAFPKPVWLTLSERISGLSLGQEEARNLRRLIFSGAAEVELDRQGRVLIPLNLREYASLSEQVIIAGLNTHFEIWSRERWHEVLNTLDNSAGSIAEQLSALGV